jgi:hypothetical protein
MNVKILTPTGYRGFFKIQKKQGDCVKITFDNCEVKCTKDHRFEHNGKPLFASEVYVGMVLNGHKVISIEDIGIQTVYTPVEVENGHKYLSNGFVHYNCSFLGSTATLIDGKFMNKLLGEDPIAIEDNYHLNIYEDPIPGCLYVMGVDTSTGVGNDSSTIQVIKIANKDRYEQVAVYKNDKIKPYEFARVVAMLSTRYNEAYMVLENNDCGSHTAEELWYNIGCGNILNTDGKGIGTRATPSTKLDACMMLKKAVETDKLYIRDTDTIAQLSRFEEVTPNVFKGAKGCHDDLVSSLYWAVYCLNQPQIDLENATIAVSNVQSDYAPPPCMFDESTDNSDFWRSFN